MDNYRCTIPECGAAVERSLLTVKKVYFNEMGMGGRVLKSRVIAWLCPACVAKDPHWNQPRFQSPVKVTHA